MRSRQAGRDDKSLPHPTIELQGNEEKHMSTTRPSSVMSRRTLAAGAAWSLPVVAMSTSAPAFAVSCGGVCPTVGFPVVPSTPTATYPDAPDLIKYVANTTTTRGGWTYTGAGTNAGGTSGIIANHFASNGTTIVNGTQAFQAQADPTAAGAYVQASTTMCSIVGVKMTFTVDYIWNDNNSYGGASKRAILEILVNGTVMATKDTTYDQWSGVGTGDHTGTFTFSYTPTNTNNVTYTMKVSWPGNDGMSDDFIVAAPKIVCG